MIFLTAYIAMLAFDLAVLGGTAYLVDQREWSAWWFVLSIAVLMSTTPTVTLNALRATKAKAPPPPPAAGPINGKLRPVS